MKDKKKSVAEKQGKINNYLVRLMDLTKKGVRSRKYDLALSALSAYCMIQYFINQVYSDKIAENMVLEISRRIVSVPNVYKGSKDTVLFYDGFGLDLRGWAASFAKALSSVKYNLIYVAPTHAQGKIPHIEAEVSKGNGKVCYIDMDKGYTTWIKALNDIFIMYMPFTAFFYTAPNDVAGAAVFNAYKNIVKRIQIDLTDHAFWIGKNAFDYTIESRMLGVSNMIFYRGVSSEKIVRLDPTPYICKDSFDEQLPFDIEKERYFFSGGSLYKTLGDKELLYYSIVDQLLAGHTDIKFLFAGEGDTSELNKIIEKYPGRAFYIHERSDFFRLFENSIFFLNTYPMFGGLMMRYATLAGKVPLTLKHGEDHKGIIYEQEKRGIEFDTVAQIIKEGGRLIEDDEYRSKKSADMIGACLTEEDFIRNIKQLVENGKTEFSFDVVDKIDTSEFRKEYMERLEVREVVLKAIPNRNNLSLLMYYPFLFIKKIIRRLGND